MCGATDAGSVKLTGCCPPAKCGFYASHGGKAVIFAKLRRTSSEVRFFSDISPPAANTIHMNKFIEKHKKLYFYILGAVTGICNGLFGSGGGIAAVPMLQKGGVDVKKSHATSLALTLPLSVVSAFFYAYKSSFRWGDALPLIPFGLAGAVVGGLLMKKIPNTLLKRIFGVILIISGGRLLLQ